MQENIKDLLRLIQENPDLPVIAAVESESVSDEYGRFNYDPRLPEDNEENNRNSILMDEYLDSIADQYFKKAIVVYIHPYEEN